MEFDAFISYSSKDKASANAACHVLETEGIRCWMAPRDIIPGMEWGESIVSAISIAKVMILIFSSNANASPQIRREVERAINKGIPVLPMRIENVLPTKSLEYFLGTPHWLDAFTPPLERHLQQLATAVRALLAAYSDSPEPSNGARTSARQAGHSDPTDISAGTLLRARGAGEAQ